MLQKVRLVATVLFILLLHWQCKTQKAAPQTTADMTGFKKQQYNLASSQFPPSNYLREVPKHKDLTKRTSSPSTKIIDINNPKGCKSWADCGINSKQYSNFLIVPGDYRPWGTLKLRKSGSSTQARTISYYNPSQADPSSISLPIHTPPNPNKHVILEAFEIVTSDYWVLTGLTFSGNAKKKKQGQIGGSLNRIAGQAKYNIINRCLVENTVSDAGIRISISHFNTIQNSIIRNLIGGDQVGILLKGEKDKAIGNRIINNEIYDCNDGIQLTYSPSYGKNGHVSGTIIENNDIYLTPKSYSKNKNGFACAENAIDIKIGGASSAAKDLVKILKNRIWGYRPTDTSCGGSGSRGRGITTHMKANNIILKDNIFFDLPGGISISNEGLPNPRIAILNNLFFDIKKFDPSLKYAQAINTSINADIYYNTIVDSQTALMVQSKSNSRVQCNTFINVPINFPMHNRKGWAALNAWYDCQLDPRGIYSHNSRLNIVERNANRAAFGDFSFYTKRWTNPQKIVVKNIFPDRQQQMNRIVQSHTNCNETGGGNRWWMHALE